MRKIILTIDTEGPRGSDPVLYQIWGKTAKYGYCGISKIMDICDTFGIKALFFVDIPEIWDYGYEKIRDVILDIKRRGHDVGVHVHPHHMPNENRHFLFDYSKEEQYHIIKKCTEQYINITGERPLSFRAGKYGANRDTLDIINNLGYKYDFSEFYSQKWCGIVPEIAYVLPRKYKNLVEFPVTIFKSFSLKGVYQRYDKLEVVDIPDEICHILDKYSKMQQDGVITLFMHSFSFLNYLDTPDAPTLNKRSLKNFIKVLNYIKSSGKFDFIAERDLIDTNVFENDSKDNIVTTSSFVLQLKYLLIRSWQIRKYNKPVKMAFYAFYVICMMLVIVILFVVIN